jgi:putative RecB family exonuclease
MTGMFPVPTSLSPSRVESFTSCPLAFRFSAIERLPEPASIHTAKGTYVHRVLELLFQAAPEERTPTYAESLLDVAWEDLTSSDEYLLLAPAEDAAAALRVAGAELVARYFTLEDPRHITPVGLELTLEGTVDGLVLRGIIDRLERSPSGALVVTDYKTGRAPSPNYEQRRLAGVHFYAWLCEQALGERPAEIRLLYLATGETITAYPSDQSIRFLPKRTTAVFQAIRKACTTGDFRPQPSALCGSCAFQQWCPSFGGDPELAAVEAPVRYAVPAA